MKYNKNEFELLLKEKYNEPFEIIEYNGTSKKGKFKCGYCEEIYELTKIGNLLKEDRKHICSHCFASKYAEQVLDRIKEEKHLTFKKFGYNKRSRKPTVIYSCNLCNQLTEKPYVEFLKYSTCIHCGKNAKRRLNENIQDLLPEGFELIEDYEGQYTKKLFRHKCGFIFSVRPKDIITGHSYCPKCSKKASKGERRIIEFLTKKNIAFEKEKVFNWSNRKRYDFYLPEFNLLIEYHGIQHYKEVPTFSLTLEEQQAIDNWKELEAIKQGKDFLIISYLDFDKIEDILAQRLQKIA